MNKMVAALLCISAFVSHSAHATLIGFGAFAGDNIESFENIADQLPGPNFGVNGIRGEVPNGFTTATGLTFQGGINYLNDWALGPANISSLGVSINDASDVIDGTAYWFNSVGRVVIELGTTATRFGAYMGGNGVQNTTFEMYLGNVLVDTFTTTGLTEFTSFTGWQSNASFDRIEWTGGHSGFDLFAFDGQVNRIPEPTSLLVCGLGLLGLASVRRKSRV